MKLEKYLLINRIKVRDFSKSINIPYSTLYRIIRGKKVSLRVASTIDKATDGQVSIQELVGGIYEQHGN